MLDTPDRVEPVTCTGCPGRDTCTTLCNKIQKEIRQGRFHEIDTKYGLQFFPVNKKEIRFSEYEAENSIRGLDGHFDDESGMVFNTGAVRTMKVKVFIERYLNGREYQDIADELGLDVHTVRSSFSSAKKDIAIVCGVLDARGGAARWVSKSKAKKFTDDQKCFLLSHFFGFTITEVGEIMGLPRMTAANRIKKMEKTFLDKFSEASSLPNT